jgi:hypothetical protein
VSEPIKVVKPAIANWHFTIGTLVTNMEEYREMVDSFKACGFDEGTEYLYIDNTGIVQTDAFTGLNQLLSEAKGHFVILCHQDVVCKDSKAKLLQCIADIEKKDLLWAVLGNAGGIAVKHYSKYFINGKDELEHITPVPARVQTLDENFLLIRKAANIGFSVDLSGFHFYGADLCLQAAFKGLHCYTIPFLVKHKSFGNQDHRFEAARLRFIQKYSRLLKSKAIQTTCARFVISGQRWQKHLGNTRLGAFFVKEYYKRKRK